MCNNNKEKSSDFVEQKRKKAEKEFKIRDSPLTSRFEQSADIKAIYNLFAVILIVLLFNTIIYDYVQTGKFHFGFRLIRMGFNKFDKVVVIWCILHLISCIIYFSFKLWATTRAALQPLSGKVWDKVWLTIFIVYYFGALYAIQDTLRIFDFAAGSSAILVLEQVRLLMKQYAFIRSNVPRVLSYKPHTERSLLVPDFKTFVYYFFAPTFIYRDEYPKRATGKIRWKFVFRNVGEVFAIMMLLSVVIERCLVPTYEDICKRKFTITEIVVPVLANSFPGIVFQLCGFYSVLHCVQNAFAELLGFGDRMFYKEWWTTTSLSDFYRTWNVVVHDWLFTYIYKDMYGIVVPKSKVAAKLAVFLISALVHEWILTNVLNVFLPIHFSQFFIAGAVFTLFNVLDTRIGNLMVWYLLTLGTGLQVNLYALEMFARTNCPLTAPKSRWDFFKPRFITCDCIQ